MLGTVCHAEQGQCPSCPGAEAGRRAIYQTAVRYGANFVANAPQIEYGGSGNTGGYDPNGKSNYICRGCNKKFGMLSSMIQHQNARPQCAHMASLTSSTLSIGYT